MRALLALFTVLWLANTPARAECECVWQGSFTDVEAATDLVISGTVVASKGNSIDIAVSQVLRGPEPLDPLRIWLHTADYCRPEAELFPLGTQWVMALHKINEVPPEAFNPNTPNISYGRIDDFSLSNCGGYWLRVSEGLVTGNLVNAPRWERDPPMTPVLLELVADFVRGGLASDALLQASKQDPALRKLKLDTRAFLRNETD
jgi:hypothetical protein